MLLATLASPATAADCQPKTGLSTCIDADNLWPHAGGGSFFAIGSTTTTPADRVSFGVVLSYLSRPIGLRVASADPDGTVIYAVDNALDATFLWSLGVADRLEITVAAPVTLIQDGAGTGDVVGSDDELVRSTLRDTRFGLALALVRRPRTLPIGGFGLTTRFEIGLPTGGSDSFAGGTTAVWIPTAVADYQWGRLKIAAEIGGRIRGETRLATARIGSQLSGALGVSFDILHSRLLTAGAEAFALYTFARQDPPARDRPEYNRGPALVPAEWILSASSAPLLGGDVVFSAGGGGPIPLASESAITTPRFRFNLGIRYAPTGHDTDADGVLDRDDACPAVPEDRDGFKDTDGCPDPDNDGDRIADDKDRCRDEPETVDGFQDEDGCPDVDDDRDRVRDEVDRCRNAPEDRDGFEDTDGCPDPDNDKDGLLDGNDRCPNGAEDKDGYKDDDGCPDPDNDFDQVLDAVDQCPTLGEDRDGFADGDGCPEPDNDQDGVLDAADACPVTAETIDGRSDEDGCPEPGAQSRVQFSGDSVVLTGELSRFPAGSDKPSKELEQQIRMIAQLIRGRVPLSTVIVEAYADRPGDESPRALDLAEKRASRIKSIIAGAGVPADIITAATGDLAQARKPSAPQFDITAQRATVKGTKHP
jgi:outer membrane protein OmpA-like peptidoglycan-associated protein